MEWFLAKLVYRFYGIADNTTAYFDEQIRLIEAEDQLHAFHKAQQIGHQEQSQANITEESGIRWSFIDVTELYMLNRTMDGAEVLSQMHQSSDPGKYQKNVRLKAGYLLSDCTDRFLQAL